jgi:hydroxymethylpyrimidine kinase/phosphomethylpyrimidine kinase
VAPQLRVRSGVPRVLAVAGSDSGGGAGIQADLKTLMALGVYGATAVTALTAQNTHGVSDVHAVPAPFLAAQMAAVLQDIGADVVKTGMLPTPEV